MVNKSGRIGTEAENAVVRYMKASGWPAAERRKPEGKNDRGDINSGQPRLVVEVKADKALAFPQFLRETEAERVNAGAAVGVCVIKPPTVAGRRMNLWWMLMGSGTFDALSAMANWPHQGEFSVYWGERRKGNRSFNPARVLADVSTILETMPGTRLRPGAKRVSTAGWDMRFLYLPDGLELLRLAGLGVDHDTQR